jgi:hypothetical protein
MYERAKLLGKRTQERYNFLTVVLGSRSEDGK